MISFLEWSGFQSRTSPIAGDGERIQSLCYISWLSFVPIPNDRENTAEFLLPLKCKESQKIYTIMRWIPTKQVRTSEAPMNDWITNETHGNRSRQTSWKCQRLEKPRKSNIAHSGSFFETNDIDPHKGKLYSRRDFPYLLGKDRCSLRDTRNNDLRLRQVIQIWLGIDDYQGLVQRSRRWERSR